MKQITLKNIAIRNFKGTENAHYVFEDKGAIIAGINGSGKTTIFDAFTWLLFGKDHEGRTKFDLKPRNREGNEIQHLETYVFAHIAVDGQEIQLRRMYKENWKKKRGSIETYLAGHTETYEMDGEPLTAKKYKYRIAEICPEDLFRAITNPRHFAEQKPEEQRKLLFQLVSINPEDVAEELTKLAKGRENIISKEAGTKNPDSYRKTLAAERKQLQAEVDTIPARIAELEQQATTADTAELDKQIAAAEKRLEELNNDPNAAKRAQVVELRNQYAAREHRLRAHTFEAYSAQTQALEEGEKDLQQRVEHAKQEAAKIEVLKGTLKNMDERREKLIEAWKAIKAETFEIDPSDLRCPCCGRAFEPQQAEEKMAELEANFNSNKAQRLKENGAQGLKLKDERAKVEAELESAQQAEASITSLETELNSLRAKMKARATCEETQAKAVQKNAELQSEREKIEALEAELESVDTEALQAEDKKLRETIYELMKQHAGSEQAKKAKARIVELRTQLKQAGQKLAEVERKEDDLATYSRAFGMAAEKKVNEKFELVKFSLFDYTLDGTPKETCKAQVNGIAYGSTLNTAAQINAGLDIIRTLSRHYGIFAPVFVDNAESCNHLIDIPSQTFELRVKDDSNITEPELIITDKKYPPLNSHHNGNTSSSTQNHARSRERAEAILQRTQGEQRRVHRISD